MNLAAHLERKTEVHVIMAQSLSRLLLALLVVGPFAITTSAQSAVPIRDQPLRVVDYSGDMLALIAQFSSTFDTAFSFEIDPLEPRPNITFRVIDATLDDIMNAIVKAKPTYAWRRNGNAIELYPAGHTNRLLETRISSLRISNTRLKEALQILLFSTEINTALANFGLLHGPIRGVDDQNKAVSVSADDITLRQALNQIAEAGSVRFWAFEMIGPNRDIVSITFGTETR